MIQNLPFLLHLHTSICLDYTYNLSLFFSVTTSICFPPRFLLPCIRRAACFQSSTPSGRISMAFSTAMFPAQGSVHSTAASTQQHTSKVKSPNVRILTVMPLVNPGLRAAKSAKIKRDHRLDSLVNSCTETPCNMYYIVCSYIQLIIGPQQSFRI